MLATLALPSALDPLRDSLRAIFKPSCSATETITDRLASVPSGGCDCVADASTCRASYAACLKSEEQILARRKKKYVLTNSTS